MMKGMAVEESIMKLLAEQRKKPLNEENTEEVKEEAQEDTSGEEVIQQVSDESTEEVKEDTSEECASEECGESKDKEPLDETAGLDVKEKFVGDNTFTIEINGKSYAYTAKPGINLSGKEMKEKFNKISKFSIGKALAWLKKNADTAQSYRKKKTDTSEEGEAEAFCEACGLPCDDCICEGETEADKPVEQSTEEVKVEEKVEEQPVTTEEPPAEEPADDSPDEEGSEDSDEEVTYTFDEVKAIVKEAVNVALQYVEEDADYGDVDIDNFDEEDLQEIITATVNTVLDILENGEYEDEDEDFEDSEEGLEEESKSRKLNEKELKVMQESFKEIIAENLDEETKKKLDKKELNLFKEDRDVVSGGLEEEFKKVFRHGVMKKRRIRHGAKIRLNGKQKAALRKARRFAHRAAANRSRKISMRKGKRLGLHNEASLYEECKACACQDFDLKDGVYICKDCGEILDRDPETAVVAED